MIQTLDLAISGMSCDHCVARVTRALQRHPGLTIQEVRIGSARVTYDPSVVSVESVLDALDDAGYPARAASERG